MKKNSLKVIKSGENQRPDFKKGTGHAFVKPPGASKARTEMILKSFIALWERLWSSSIHLDSALSKQTPQTKSILAQILPLILLRPASQAEALGVGVGLGEPWNLKLTDIARWRPAPLMFERMYEMMVQGNLAADPREEDFPPHIVSELEKSWGVETMRFLVDALCRSAPLSLRASRRVGAQALLKKLATEVALPVRAELSSLSPFGVKLAGYAPVLNTELYKSGNFEIQDEGSQFMVLFALWPEIYGKLLRDQPGNIPSSPVLPPPVQDMSGMTVIDACAGAGGKSLAIADLMNGKGRVYAYDTSEKKLQALRRRAKRSQLNNMQSVLVQEGQESILVDQFKNTANVVLVDAPCSGWGVLRRNPDIKWRQGTEVLERMPVIQSRLLSIYSGLVAPGGRLVYGVCTFRLAETVEVVKKFLHEHPEFSEQQGGFLGPDSCDGFYMKSFIKKR